MLCLIWLILVSPCSIHAQLNGLDYKGYEYDYDALEDAEPCRRALDCRPDPTFKCRCVWGKCVLCGGPKQKRTKSFGLRLSCDQDFDCIYFGSDCWCDRQSMCRCLGN